jgi:hypothetical protein
MKNVNIKNINYVFVKLTGKLKKFKSYSSSEFFSYWIKNFAMHFDLDKRLKEACEKMQHAIELSNDNECMNLVDLSQMYVYFFFFINTYFRFQTII